MAEEISAIIAGRILQRCVAKRHNSSNLNTLDQFHAWLVQPGAMHSKRDRLNASSHAGGAAAPPVAAAAQLRQSY
jgi:hypothetical protein